MSAVIDLVEQGKVPDWLTRIGIKRLLRQRLKQEQVKFRQPEALNQFLSAMADSPLAINTSDANQQHYEVPTEFYEHALGAHKKYSAAYFRAHVSSLSTAEEDMLKMTCERAGISDNMKILELGCGWGSLTLWMARLYPNCQITAVSNSATQKDYIDSTANARGLDNITIITSDMNEFTIDEKFDRVISIEMFEHMRNYNILFNRISQWLKPDGKLFFHIFCHKTIPYFFETEGESDWMAENFFTGGLMPSYDLPLSIDSNLELEDRWAINGTHYAKTSRAWLNQLDANRTQAIEVLKNSHDPTPEIILFNRWRMFFMACEELFAYNQGNEWHVGHYLFGNKN
ncbi:MAG: cyclopropane-fatty-acyl-phospholipid synthase family protein [Pseudomonadales bacterium]|nr:cyclopropane-fatty-acyl-phospholipid synthase family protein [Pseudomonadales bacterium]